MDELYEYMQNQIQQINSTFKRYMYERLPWDARMFALIGPRGVGKTTLFLQRIKDEHKSNEALYVSLDHIYFASHTLLELASDFYKYGGKFLYVDEVHNYENWARELKNIYDAFPSLHIYFTGSSALNILNGEADLSRRAPIYQMQGLSFREFLCMRTNMSINPFTLDEILAGKAELTEIEHPLVLFKEYLETGYYPFIHDASSNILVEQIVNATLQFDIPVCAKLSLETGRKLKKLLAAVAESIPFKPNASKLAKKIGVSRNSINEYLALMESAGMIARLRVAHASFAELGKVEKVYLDNTTIMNVLAGKNTNVGCMRETFFLNQMRVNNNVCASKESDFEIDGNTFEVGGKNKTGAQIKGISKAFLVKDNIEKPYLNTIPLWCFGLNY